MTEKIYPCKWGKTVNGETLFTSDKLNPINKELSPDGHLSHDNIELQRRFANRDATRSAAIDELMAEMMAKDLINEVKSELTSENVDELRVEFGVPYGAWLNQVNATSEDYSFEYWYNLIFATSESNLFAESPKTSDSWTDENGQHHIPLFDKDGNKIVGQFVNCSHSPRCMPTKTAVRHGVELGYDLKKTRSDASVDAELCRREKELTKQHKNTNKNNLN